MLAAALFLQQPKQAYAQVCEFPGTTMAYAATLDVAQLAAVSAMVESLMASILVDTMAAQAATLAALKVMDTLILARLDKFWVDLFEAIKAMTAQLSAAESDQSRQLLSDYDSSVIGETARHVQEAELEAKRAYVPTNQGCQFDTAARYLGNTTALAGAMETGLSLDFNRIGNNHKDTPANAGPVGVLKFRWDKYMARFCDKNSALGKVAGCTATHSMANAHILPSKTIFSKETIDLADAGTRDAVNQLMYNITGFEAPQLMTLRAAKTPAGRQSILEQRQYLAQMDAAGALAYSVVAERTPGKKAPEIMNMRKRMGATTASDKPSEREVRQAIVEELWDPAYYADLVEGGNTITQKEVFLKAYTVLLMYKLIEKTEMIANAYALETSNLLYASDHSRDAVMEREPLQ